MAFTLSLMTKTFSPLTSFRTSLQLRRTIVLAGAPPRKEESSGKGGKIHGVKQNSLNSSSTAINDQLNDMKREVNELDGSANKPKASS